MKVNVIAPQPFFIERGTPIAVRMLVEALASVPSITVQLTTYRGGEDVKIPGVKHKRIWSPRYLEQVSPGISIKKILCDLILTCQLLPPLIRKENRKDLLFHAVEESLFIALLAKILFRVPYVYDMDSVLSEQLLGKWPILAVFSPLFRQFERLAIRNAKAVIAVCDSLASYARNSTSAPVHVLTDASLLELFPKDNSAPLIRNIYSIPASSKVIFYAGNLEYYQGIDLLLDSFATVATHHTKPHLVLAGGNASQIKYYAERLSNRKLLEQVHFMGHQPLRFLGDLLTQADILVSPRLNGENTPMKIYSYLHAGKPILATNLKTHTQVLNSENSVLAKPDADSFGEALSRLITDPLLCERIGMNANELAESEFTAGQYRKKLLAIFSTILSSECTTEPFQD